MRRFSLHQWFGATLAFLGLMGVAIALTAVLVGLPSPAAGGTCGPGRTSESALQAFLDPGSIGAGSEPPATNAVRRLDWLAFVGECQAATNERMLDGVAIIVLSIGVLMGGLAIVRRSAGRQPVAAAPAGWYADPVPSSSAVRWWDGQTWGAVHPVTPDIPDS